jgi:hypothetical protein
MRVLRKLPTFVPGLSVDNFCLRLLKNDTLRIFAMELCKNLACYVADTPQASGCGMSDKFDSLHGIEKAAMENVLNRSHVLAAKIADELRNRRPEHFVDTVSLADIYYSLEHIADVLSTVKGSQGEHAQEHK